MDAGATGGTADCLVTGIDWLVTVDRDRRVLRDGAVAIAGGRFAAVGKTAEVTASWTSETVIPGRHRVATPGLVDTHMHSSFQMSRGLADEASARAFLFDRMYPYEGALGHEDVAASATLAAMELLRHGVTCFVEHGNYHPGATAAAAEATGIRLTLCRSAFDQTRSVLGLLPEAMIETTDEAVAATEALLEQYGNRPGDRIRAGASFRGLNNATDELITRMKDLADRHDTLLQTHACFSYSTRDASVDGHGMTEIERLDRLGVLDPKFLVVHGGWLEPADVAIICARKPSIAAAPSSSLHNGYGNMAVGRIPELMDLGVNVALGSDHASSGVVDMVQEMLLVAGGYKEARANPRVMPPERVLEMATVNGALAAGREEEIGSVEVGRRADMVLFDTRRPEWQPLFNPVSNLVYSATGSSVETVFVDGERVVDGGRLTRIDEGDVYAEVDRAAARLAERLDIPRMVQLRWPVE